MVVWVVPETLEVTVTLYRDPQAATFDDKSWNFLVVNESRGRRSVVAAAPLELGRLAGVGETPLNLTLRPRSRRVTAATLRLRLRGVVLREGHPTDEDMQSVTSLSPPGDVADLGDFESDPSLGTRRDPPEPGGDSEPPPEITAGPPGGRGALLAWCQGVTAGYRGVAVTDFGGSWSSGLGFCALLHRLRPREIDFDALDPRDHRGNNKRGGPREAPPETPPDPRSDVSEGGPQMSPPETPPDPRSDVSEGGPQETLPETPLDPRSGSIEEGTPPESRSDVTEGGPQTTPPGTPPPPPSGSSEEGPQEPPGDPQTPPETQTGTPPEPQISVTEGGPQETPADSRGDVTEGEPQETPADPRSDVTEGEPQEIPPDPPQPCPTERGAPPDPQPPPDPPHPHN
ncbi:PREDICTED: EH domain-binding protein 1-like protein 1 [Pseudopodoces humilis]|uniref:EH domain-binding protein 1-like protein 1 n=1 Tax=Pseudopodoces humilis TaxID=181119 RepID=UPI0006B783D4|nr:PREDICTED: EH domain-binding protein 1-like protein 1 [Pseudopodoces humilis]